tara:strand:+ start:2632 stop:3312 length:681 start_codon:yes stop_codon:yes gene_type:complete
MYDIVFISYEEPNADDVYAELKERYPMAKRVHGVKGIHQAHIAAAKKCFTKMFWVVDGDAKLKDDFTFDYICEDWDLDAVHVWRCENPVNLLVYGYGGVKLLPRQLTIDMDVTKPDMTTSISNKFYAHTEISNVTAFNTDPFNTWKSAFRECVKLSSKLIRGQIDDETETRLLIWCNEGMNKPNGDYAMMGARAGKKYGEENKDNKEALFKINDFDWLKEMYDKEN